LTKELRLEAKKREGRGEGILRDEGARESLTKNIKRGNRRKDMGLFYKSLAAKRGIKTRPARRQHEEEGVKSQGPKEKEKRGGERPNERDRQRERRQQHNSVSIYRGRKRLTIVEGGGT